MAFDLNDEELKATRIMNGTVSKKELYERITELEEIEKDHKKENGELRERIKELESELQHKNDQLFLEDIQWEKNIRNNYILKSKLKEIVDKRNEYSGYTSLDAMEDIEKLLEERR